MPDLSGGWTLSGEKYLVDSGAWASVIAVFAQTSDFTGRPAGVSAFAIPRGTPGLSVGPESLTMGLKGMVQNDLRLDRVRVGAEGLLGSVGAGIQISQEILSIARLHLAAKSVGGMKRCLQLLLRYASRRHVATGLLWENPVTQSRVGQIISAVGAVESLVERIANGVDAGEEIPAEAFLACKVAASEYLWKTADALLQALGGRGYEEPNLASQILRDARSFRLSEGPTETLLMYVGSRVIHAGRELDGYIAKGLGSRRVADRLSDGSERIRAFCARIDLPGKIGVVNASYWVSSRVGEAAMWAVLAAAAEHGDHNGHQGSGSWASRKLEESIRAGSSDGPAYWALARAETARDLIAGYSETIGDVEQIARDPRMEPDPLLRRQASIIGRKGAPAALDLPIGGEGTACDVELSDSASAGLRVLASKAGVPVEAAFLAALGALVHRHTASEKVTIRLEDGARGLDVSMRFPTGVSMEETLAQVAGALDVRAAGRDRRCNADDAAPEVVLVTFGASAPPFPSGGALTVVLRSEDASRSEWTYEGRSLGRSHPSRLAERLDELLKSWIREPSALVSRLSILSAPEHQQIVHAWNETSSAYPESCVHHLFEGQAERGPQRVAVVCDGDSMTYGELDARADRLAWTLHEFGVRPGMPVGLCVDRSVELVVSILGILKAGGAYVPLDTGQPARRLAHVLEDTRVPVIVADPELAKRLPAHSARLIFPGARSKLAPFDPREDAMGSLAPDNTAYVLYTSGSTGKPKGVEVCHRSVVNFLVSMQRRPGFSENDVLVAITTISFDIAGLELFLPLVSGGCVVLANDRTARDGVALSKLIEESAATVVQATPATWQMLLSSGWTGSPRLKALCGGDSLTGELARSIRSRTASLWNMYGPTETTIWSCIDEVTADPDPITIGRPIDNTRVYLLNGEFQPVPVDVAAEIFIGGDGVARGYWNRPDLTAERFLPDPFRPGERIYRTGDAGRFQPDGRVEHLGRLDRQVKIRGFRVELAEIETALASHPALQEAVVEPHRIEPDDVRLVAFVTLGDGTAPAGLVSALRRHVAERVPAYMVPGSFIVLPSLPLTPNGKLDRKALRVLAAEEMTPEPVAFAGSHVEREIGNIWSGLLRAPKLDLDSDFFLLGGHSLLATQVVSRLREAFGVEIPIGVMFERTTIAALANAVSDALENRFESGAADAPYADRFPAGASPWPALERVERSAELELSAAQQALWLLDRLEPGSARYNAAVAFQLNGALDVETLRASIDAMVERHESLRTRFEVRAERPVQTIDPAGAWPVSVVDLESAPDALRDAARRRWIQEEAERPFDLERGPLARAILLRSSPTEHVLLVTLHHIISDGWSMEVLLRDLAKEYEARLHGRSASLSPLRFQHADFASWQRKRLRGPAFEGDLAYWREQLRGLPPLELPADRRRGSGLGHRGAIRRFALSATLSETLHRLGQRERATDFMTLMAAWQALLSRHSGQEDFGVGFPIANRVHPDAERVMGCFVNTLVLRADLAGDPSFVDLLRRVRERAIDAYAHQAVPFEQVVQELGVRRQVDRNPLFQVMFDLQNAPWSEVSLPGIEVTPLPVTTRTAKFDMTLTAREQEGRWVGHWEYSADLFEASTIERMAGHFETLLEAVAADPDQRVGDLPLVPSIPDPVS
ncbi:MAG: amino acid adenylation domain-containing protein [Acidobacteriota bacterium]|nr:amino acid adenylation domain-containing protein [Acidobacteriota bacterium]